MTLRACPHEAEIRSLLLSGHWPHACPPELRAHATSCQACGDLVLITQAFRGDRAEAAGSVQLPPPGVLWWRAQLRRRNAAIERIGRPLLGAHIFAFAVAVLIAIAILFSQGLPGLRWLTALQHAPAFHISSLWSSSTLDSAQWLGLNWNLPYLIPGVALLVLLGGVFVYLASAKQ